MQSVVFQQFGEPADVLTLADTATSRPGHGEVRVRMLASPVNPSDLMNIRGIYGMRPELPATPGFEGVGVVEQSGGGLLARLMAGQRVIVLNGSGGNWAQQTIVPARQVIPCSGHLTVEQAATFFINPATALIMTRDVLCPAPGEWLLQTAAASTLGRMVIRLGRQFGFRTLNVVRRTNQVDELLESGADDVVVFDAAKSNDSQLTDHVNRVTGGKGVRHAIDAVGGATGSAVVGCLGQGARMLVYGTLSGDPLVFSSRSLMTPGGTVEGFWLSGYMNRLRLLARLRIVRRVSRLIRDGVLKSDIGPGFTLDQIHSAVREAERSHRRGKVLLRISDG